MRFKKLRKFVETSLLIFIVIVGLIILIGMAQKFQQPSNLAIAPSRNQNAVRVASSPSGYNNQQQAQPAQNTRTVFHQVIRTGAS